MTNAHTELQMAYHEFFADLLTRLIARSLGSTKRTSAPYGNVLGLGAGRSGFTFTTKFPREGDLSVSLYGTRKAEFVRLENDKKQIEEKLGKLVWMKYTKGFRILVRTPGGIDSHPNELNALKDWAVEQLLKFKDVFGPKIKGLNLEVSSEGQQ